MNVWVVRHWLVLAIGGLLLTVVGTAPAFAITPFNGFSCIVGSTASQTAGPFASIPPSTATVTVDATEDLIIEVTNGTAGTLRRNDTLENVIVLPLRSSGTVSGQANVTLEVLAGGLTSATNNISIRFRCVPKISQPLPSGGGTGPVVDELLNDQLVPRSGFSTPSGTAAIMGAMTSSRQRPKRNIGGGFGLWMLHFQLPGRDMLALRAVGRR